MIEAGSVEYAQARVHARHGERPDAADWRRIEVLRDFAPALEQARATALAAWLTGMTADSRTAQIEVRLAEQWRRLVAEVAGWMPLPWRPAIAWCAWLPDLPLLQHLARGGEAPSWLHEDEVWRELAAAPPPLRAGVLAAGPAGALAGAWSTPRSIGGVWLAAWRSLLPRRRGEADVTLEALVRLLLDHARTFAVATPSLGWSLRASLQEQLARLLRRSALQPVVAFIHLALCALDLERLRGELLRRAILDTRKAA